MPAERDNRNAGLFVVVGLVLCGITVFVLSDWRGLLTPDQTVRVRYQLSDGVRGLRSGSMVTLGGAPVGAVTRIDDAIVDGRVQGQVVSFTLPEHYRMGVDAEVELVVPPIGSTSKLNIRDVGDVGAYDPDGPPLTGYLAPNDLADSLAEELGIGDRQKRQIQVIVRDLADATGQLRERAPALFDRADAALGEIEPLGADARLTLAEIRDAVEQVRLIADAINARREPWLAQVDSILESSDATLGRVNTMTGELEPDVRATVASVRSAAERVDGPMLDRVDQTLVETQRTMRQAGEAADAAQSLLASQRPIVEQLLADLQIAGAQLKLATIEIRRAPWRLLYRPDDQELETDNLYDAMRSFALAASSLQAATASLEAVADRRPAGDAEVQRYLDYLHDLLDEVRPVERRLWRALEHYDPTDAPGP